MVSSSSMSAFRLDWFKGGLGESCEGKRVRVGEVHCCRGVYMSKEEEVYIHVYMYTRIYAYMYTCIHVYMYTCNTHTLRWLGRSDNY